MTTNQEATEIERSCSECGYLDCPHMAKKLELVLPLERSYYYPYLCASFDHKHPVIQMENIDYALKEYFSDGLLVDSSFENWLEVRNKRFPELK